jgi:putative FmdB family regulatory protein
MPKLEYRCKACGEIFERIVLAGEEDGLPACPACGSADVSRTAGAPPLFDGIAAFSSLAGDRN